MILINSYPITYVIPLFRYSFPEDTRIIFSKYLHICIPVKAKCAFYTSRLFITILDRSSRLDITASLFALSLSTYAGKYSDA